MYIYYNILYRIYKCYYRDLNFIPTLPIFNINFFNYYNINI